MCVTPLWSRRPGGGAPPIMMARLARHADIVDDFYDVLDGEDEE
jgi:hypothetical protein